MLSFHYLGFAMNPRFALDSMEDKAWSSHASPPYGIRHKDDPPGAALKHTGENGIGVLVIGSRKEDENLAQSLVRESSETQSSYGIDCDIRLEACMVQIIYPRQ